MKRLISLIIFATGVFFALNSDLANAADNNESLLRNQAAKAFRDGNAKDAHDLYKKLLLENKSSDPLRGMDLHSLIKCLQRINSIDAIDGELEQAASLYKDDALMLLTVAKEYMGVNHNGYIVEGKFSRGYNRGGTGKYASSDERDRVRAIQLLLQALKQISNEKGISAYQFTNKQPDLNLLSYIYETLADALMPREVWKLQLLTNLNELPDYDEEYPYYSRHSGNQGAPVNADGTPVFYHIPESFESAKNDGERWRWTLESKAKGSAQYREEADLKFAKFLDSQFGVRTLGSYYRLPLDNKETGELSTGTFALHTLTDQETIARLASGVKRLTLPEEFNFVLIFKRLATKKDYYQVQALNALATIYEDRRQYPQAVKYLEQIVSLAPTSSSEVKSRLKQIVGNWGEIEPVKSFVAGKPAVINYRFRNARSARFSANRIDAKAFINDLQEYLKSNPTKLDGETMSLEEIGEHIINGKKAKYLREEVASWSESLSPRENHFDRRTSITTPLKQAGLYLLNAAAEGGNKSSIIIWINDTVIVEKNGDGKQYYYVADALTGLPLAETKLHFFGYRVQYPNDNILNEMLKRARMRQFDIITSEVDYTTDVKGLVAVSPNSKDDRFVWFVTNPKSDRFIYFVTNPYYNESYRELSKDLKAFGITDRPVYRPGQTVKYKFWVEEPRYNDNFSPAYANKSLSVEIQNPKGEKIKQANHTTDEYGGIDGEFVIPSDAPLGSFAIRTTPSGYLTFRVEEYKKPEFEVSVEAPKEPIQLGDKINATIKAKYYYGEVVKNATVKYKVTRTNHDVSWYPPCEWDWLFGPGFWWFAYDYVWLPGWKHWGKYAPHFSWYPTRFTPPEIVSESEGKIGGDGTLTVTIDTGYAKEVHGDTDHSYEITAEVTDQSRRTIVGIGSVIAAREPFKVYVWTDRGYYNVDETVNISLNAHTVDSKPVKGQGELKLLKLSYKQDGTSSESLVEKFEVDTNDDGQASVKLNAKQKGQYRLSYSLTSERGRTLEGGYVFTVRGDKADSANYRFSEIELVPDKREYVPGEKVKLLINTDQSDSTVLLFIRPEGGIYPAPKVLSLKGKSTLEEIPIDKADMPNIYVEALTIHNGNVYTTSREIVVPPEKRILDVELLPSATKYKPGEKAQLRLKIKNLAGDASLGSAVITVYDKAVEYISGGSNVSDIKKFFWSWRRSYYPSASSSINKFFQEIVRTGELRMADIGFFGATTADDLDATEGSSNARVLTRSKIAKSERGGGWDAETGAASESLKMAASSAPMGVEMKSKSREDSLGESAPGESGAPAVMPTVRKNFADAAVWLPSLKVDANGIATVDFTMPENLTSWKIKSWVMGAGAVVGEASVEVVTSKDLLVRLQAPRFFVEKDEVVLSANIHNYLSQEKLVTPKLEISADTLEILGASPTAVKIEAGGEARVDWRVKVLKEGEARVQMSALTDTESDAMEMKFPVYVHGMLKTVSYSGHIKPTEAKGTISIEVPSERRPEQTKLEVRYSPTLAGAMIDALPYLSSYPYGCTEQTLNRFLPTVITQNVLKTMGVNLASLAEKHSNLNAQEIGNDKERQEQWKRYDSAAVFDEATLKDMVQVGINRLSNMQLTDGGWGWFSGWGEESYPHTTAYVVHGLQIAMENGVGIPDNVVKRGVKWLENYQTAQVQKILNWQTKKEPYKQRADDLDAFIYMVLLDADVANSEMKEFLYRDRNELSVYAKAMFGLALNLSGDKEERDMIIRNIEQYLVTDEENQTAYLKLGNGSYWWYWYGSEIEAHAYYLKLISRVKPNEQTASWLVKYLLNNRKHSTYWNSTRDTALVVEAFADYLKGAKEMNPNYTLSIFVDGAKKKTVQITSENLFTYDNSFVLSGSELSSGKHTIEFKKDGSGPVYFNAYLQNFTLEDFITKAGLEVKINRKVYKLTPQDKTIAVSGSRGQAVDQKVEKYQRAELQNLAELKSGALVELELTIESKNDYEYLMFEDMKAAGFEPVEVRSGYNGNEMRAYVEYRDNRVVFFVSHLARGKHSVSYRLRAEIPGKFSALPAKASAMYAPELKANSDEIKLRISD